MCMWFDQYELPLAYSFLLFMVKMVRAINDNTASYLYNHYDLVVTFKIGLMVCCFSLLCTFVLTKLQNYMFGNNE